MPANAFARRFQAFFPSTQSTPVSTIHNDSTASSQRRESLPQKFLKVRIVTWNMHDSLPKVGVCLPLFSCMSEFCAQGDLTELLGEVPVYNPEWPDNPPLASILPLPANGKHPYHLVVMYFPLSPRSPRSPDLIPSAGQECPTSSGAAYPSRTCIPVIP